MTDAAWTAVAALGAAALTGLASLGVVAFQEWRRNRAAARSALHAALLEVLTRSALLASRADTMRLMVEQRSGLGEGLDIATRVRRPVDHFEFHDWMAQDWAPLMAACDEVWLRGDQEMVRLVSDVVVRSGDVLAIGTLRPLDERAIERARRWIFGEKWTPEMLAEHQQRIVVLAEARKRLVDYVRKKLGREAVEVFAQVESKEITVREGVREIMR